MVTDFEKSTTGLASLPASPEPQNLKFERADWIVFRTPEGLQQKAGVAKNRLRQLVLKELVDNALDTGKKVRTGHLGDHGFVIEDDGPGLDGTPEQIARIFSIDRPMVSTKLLRLPTRGALGNGLRVVAGAVLASGGSLVVITRNRRIVLRPEHDGTTTVVSVDAAEHPVGTRIEITFGPAIPRSGDSMFWAQTACRLTGGQEYLGKSSPWWYDVTQFHELITATGTRPVRELVAQLDGCTGGKAGEIVTAAQLDRTLCKDITREQAKRLLTVARENTKPVAPKRLGGIGPRPELGETYVSRSGTTQFGSDAPFAEIPYIVEVWVDEYEDGTDDSDLTVCVNRTPVTGDIEVGRDGSDIDAYGCGLSHTIAKAPKTKQFDIWINIVTPYMPITSDGKAPDLKPFFSQITDAVSKAVKKATNPSAGGELSQTDVVLLRLEEAIAEVRGNDKFRFNQRQLFYVFRPIVRDETGKELQIGNFNGIITNFESDNGEIEGMYREPRGTIYHPHLGETISLGTLMVEEYERPNWIFNKLVYIEKEGFSEALKEVRWGEENDCAILSSKGFSTRAARDLIDKLAEHDEDVTVFCVHDADGPGTVIHQTLQGATKARGARKITIINLGLEPWEAIKMDLEVEVLRVPKTRRPVADYVRQRTDLAPDGQPWEEWLQTHRVELNAMTTPAFIEWLTAKLAPYVGKLIPPADVLTTELHNRVEDKLRAEIAERILREANFEGQVAAAVAATEMPSAAALAEGIKKLFEREPDREWRNHIEARATELVEDES